MCAGRARKRMIALEIRGLVRAAVFQHLYAGPTEMDLFMALESQAKVGNLWDTKQSKRFNK